MKEEKKLLKGLKTKYYDEEYEEHMKFEREVQKERRRRKKKKQEEKQKNPRRTKKKNQKKTNFSNILRINPKVSAMICLENI